MFLKHKTYNLKICTLLVLSVFCRQGYSFVENATHGYSNCMTCHYAPSGGDMLNEYGRSLSSELMSTWSVKNFENPFVGLVKETKWAKFGGDLRTLQSYIDTPQIEKRSLFLMQNNLEIGLVHKKFMFIGTLGTRGGPEGSPNTGEFISERHYLLYSINDRNKIRAGKFRINYGINDPNHNRPIKRNLGFGSYSEKYNLEYSRFFNDGDIFINYSAGRIDLSRESSDERSLMARGSYYLDGSSVLGANFLYGETPVDKRTLVGFFGITPVTEKTYVIYEVDYQNKKLDTSNLESLLLNFRFGVEIMKGLRAYSIYDFQRTYAQGVNLNAPGFGIQWFPLPHFEFNVEYQAQKMSGSETNNFGFILAHIYY